MGKNILLAAMSLDLGGAETHVVGLARELHRRGYRVVVTSRGGRLLPELERCGIPHLFLPLHSRAPWRLIQAVRGMRGILKGCGIELIHAHARIPAWVGDRARRHLGLPMVTTYHGVYNATLPMRLVTRWGDRVIAVSDDVKDHLQRRFGAPPGLIRVIPNGIDLGRFHRGVPTASLAAELGLGPSNPKVVHVSRLSGSFADTALCLIKAAPRLAALVPGLELVLVGDGNRFEEVREAASEVNRRLGRRAILVAGGQEEVAPYLAMADVVVGVARVAMEAMACEKPVVIAGEGGLRGLLTPDNLEDVRTANFTARGSGAPLTAEGLARAVMEVLSNQSLAAAAASFGLQVVEESYSMPRMVDRLEEVYREVLEEGNVPWH